MKTTHVKETLKDAEAQIRKLNYELHKAKHKLEILRRRSSMLYAKLKMHIAFVEAANKAKAEDAKKSKEVNTDLSHMMGEMVLIENGS